MFFILINIFSPSRLVYGTIECFSRFAYCALTRVSGHRPSRQRVDDWADARQISDGRRTTRWSHSPRGELITEPSLSVY